MTVSDALIGGIIVSALSTACATVSTAPLHASFSLIASHLSRNSLIERNVLARAARGGAPAGRRGSGLPEPSHRKMISRGRLSHKIHASKQSFGGGTSDAFRRKHDQQNHLHLRD